MYHGCERVQSNVSVFATHVWYGDPTAEQLVRARARYVGIHYLGR